MNKAIQRRGVEANGAMGLQPVEAPGPVCQQTVKSIKVTKYWYNIITNKTLLTLLCFDLSE